MPIDPLPGGQDDSAGYVYNRLKHKSEADLMAEAALIQEELKRRAELAKKPKFPIVWDDFRLCSTKDDRDVDADVLGLEGSCAHNFRYAGLELTFRVEIHEDGTTVATHIRCPKTSEYLPLPAHMKLN